MNSLDEQKREKMSDTIPSGMLTEEEFSSELEHAGVKGMRWGVTRSGGAQAGADRKAARKERREQVDTKIDEARQRISSGQNANAIKVAKENVSLAKKAREGLPNEKGNRRDARQILKEAKLRNRSDAEIAALAKSGKETTAAIIGTIAGATLITIGAALR